MNYQKLCGLLLLILSANTSYADIEIFEGSLYGESPGTGKIIPTPFEPMSPRLFQTKLEKALKPIEKNLKLAVDNVLPYVCNATFSGKEFVIMSMQLLETKSKRYFLV